MEIIKFWDDFNGVFMSDKDIRKAFKRKINENVVIELIEEIKRLENIINNGVVKNIRIGDYVSFRTGGLLKKTGKVMYFSKWCCVIRTDDEVDNYVDFSLINHQIYDILRQD